MASLLDRYQTKNRVMLSCFDRVIIQGTLPGLCYPGGMTTFLYLPHIRIFDYARFAMPLRDRIRANAEAVAEQPGLVHIFSALETCPLYKPWHDRPPPRPSSLFLFGFPPRFF